MQNYLSNEDYEEPRCPLNMHPEVTPIPVGRILDRLDVYFSRKDFDAAERHLRYWLSEADTCHDMRGKLTLLNEAIGFYRKTEKASECLEAINAALSLAASMEPEQPVTYGTTLVNAATGYKAFGMAEESLPLYLRARTIYEASLSADDGRLGGLYNNMALTLTELEAFREAENLFKKAIEVMGKQENGALEIAITYLNLCDLIAAKSSMEDGMDEIDRYLSEAEKLLDTGSLPRDSYYAFVCEKCAPVFGYYGYFATEQELYRRAEEINEWA